MENFDWMTNQKCKQTKKANYLEWTESKINLKIIDNERKKNVKKYNEN